MAFSAYLDHTLSNIGNDQTIEFNKIILNEGGGYDQRTGVFTCPQSGLYLITFFIGNILSPVDTQRRKNVLSTSICIDVDATLYKRLVPAGSLS